jgi:cellulose synthase (UDP-forming)
MRKPMNLQIRKVDKNIILSSIFVTGLYISWWFNPGHIGNPVLYGLLLFGELYHVSMALMFWHTVWPRRRQKSSVVKESTFSPVVDVFITTAGEPAEILKETVAAALAMDYQNKRIYILNDGFAAKKDNWRSAELIAAEYSITCITRRDSHGAKAGNINNVLRQTSGEIIVVLDADMIPSRDFLQTVIPYFHQKNIGFVQTPQYYANHDKNVVTSSAWDQQAFFFGPIMEGKGKVNAAFICGTNVAIRRIALEEVGGMAEDNIAEDFLTSLYIHQKGWKSRYLTKIMSEGLAPEDILSYYNQQLRWARGSLEILFKHNPLFSRHLTVSQKSEYLSSGLYYFNGVVLLIDIIMPLIFLFFGLQPVSASTTSFAIFFIPFITLNLYTLFLASAGTFSYKALSFSQSSWTLQIIAVLSVLLNRKMKFNVTSKKALQGKFMHLAYPHLVYVALAVSGFFISIFRDGPTPSVMTNTAWALFNISLFLPFIHAAAWYKPAAKSKFIEVKKDINNSFTV